MMCHIALLKISCYASFLLNTTKDFITAVLDHIIRQINGAQLVNTKTQTELSKNLDGVHQIVQEVCYLIFTQFCINQNQYNSLLFMHLVCRHSTGLCNVLGITKCSQKSCSCKFEHYGDRCEKCKTGTYLENNFNITLEENGYGVECKCRFLLYHLTI